MIEAIANDTIVTLGGAGGLVALALYLRRVFKAMGLEDTRQGGEIDVIKTLRDEVDRLATTNKGLSDAISSLQQEIIKLRNENISLIGEIGALRNENAKLTYEVERLREEINHMDTKCETCPYKKEGGGDGH